MSFKEQEFRVKTFKFTFCVETAKATQIACSFLLSLAFNSINQAYIQIHTETKTTEDIEMQKHTQKYTKQHSMKSTYTCHTMHSHMNTQRHSWSTVLEDLKETYLYNRYVYYRPSASDSMCIEQSNTMYGLQLSTENLFTHLHEVLAGNGSC